MGIKSVVVDYKNLDLAFNALTHWLLAKVKEREPQNWANQGPPRGNMLHWRHLTWAQSRRWPCPSHPSTPLTTMFLTKTVSLCQRHLSLISSMRAVVRRALSQSTMSQLNFLSWPRHASTYRFVLAKPSLSHTSKAYKCKTSGFRTSTPTIYLQATASHQWYPSHKTKGNMWFGGKSEEFAKGVGLALYNTAPPWAIIGKDVDQDIRHIEGRIMPTT